VERYPNDYPLATRSRAAARAGQIDARSASSAGAKRPEVRCLAWWSRSLLKTNSCSTSRSLSFNTAKNDLNTLDDTKKMSSTSWGERATSSWQAGPGDRGVQGDLQRGHRISPCDKINAFYSKT